MTTLPNEQPKTETPGKPRGKGSCLLKLLIAILAGHLIVTILDATLFHGVLVEQFLFESGAGQLEIDNLVYHIVPEQNEIVMTWTESVTRRTRPFGKTQTKMNEETFERHIPLDPLPPELVRCYIDVTVDPGAHPVGLGRYDGIPAQIPAFWEWNVTRTEPEAIHADQCHDLPPDMVFHITIRPEDIGVLSREFFLSARPEWHISMIMFPYAVEEDGRRVMYMTRNGSEHRLYWNEWIAPRIEAHRNLKPTFLQRCQQLICLPVAALGDEILLGAILFGLIAHSIHIHSL